MTEQQRTRLLEWGLRLLMLALLALWVIMPPDATVKTARPPAAIEGGR